MTSLTASIVDKCVILLDKLVKFKLELLKNYEIEQTK